MIGRIKGELNWKGQKEIALHFQRLGHLDISTNREVQSGSRG